MAKPSFPSKSLQTPTGLKTPKTPPSPPTKAAAPSPEAGAGPKGPSDQADGATETGPLYPRGRGSPHDDHLAAGEGVESGGGYWVPEVEAQTWALERYTVARLGRFKGGEGEVEIGRVEVCAIGPAETSPWARTVKLPYAPQMVSLRHDLRRRVLYGLFLHRLGELERRKAANDTRRWNCRAIPGMVGKRCKSWRCLSCAPWRVRLDAWKLERAMAKRPRWFWLVTTLDSPLQRRDRETNYAEFSVRWNRAMLAFRKAFGEDTVYLQTIEAHTGENGKGSHQPHANTLFASDYLTKASKRRAAKVKAWWKKNGPRWGFGRVLSFVEVDQKRVGNASKYIAGFGVQSFAKTSAISAEVAKLKQIPTFAPKGTRRLRASKGLIPGDEEFYAALPRESHEKRVEREQRTRTEHAEILADLVATKRRSLLERIESVYRFAEESLNRQQDEQDEDGSFPHRQAVEAED